jgi:ABC-type nitrate/sulfonate/bicarbonate transport system permease component
VNPAGSMVARYAGVLAAAGVCAAIFGWEVAATAGVLSPLLLPAPSVIARQVAALVASGELARQTGATLSRMFLGLILGGVPGAAVGLAMGWSRRLGRLLDPLVAASHPLPKIALLPLVVVVFGIGDSSKIVVIAVSAFFPMLVSAMAGVRQISPIHFEVARSCGARQAKVLTRVVLPGSLPMLVTGTRLALNTALLLTMAVELVLTQNGLGSMIWMAWQTLRVEQLYAALIVVSALGFLFNALLERLGTWLAPWQAERTV